MRILAFAACMLVGCGGGGAPDILGLTDQVAVVGQELVLELEGVDPDGDRLSYDVSADLDLAGRAVVSQTPSGNGVFRWTPVASDVGIHAFDFTVSDGDNKTTVSIEMDVRSTAAGLPVFIQPLGTGRVVNLAANPCVDVEIVIEDQDTAQVTIAEEEPITGAELTQNDGRSGSWRWCPTSAQVAASDRYTLTLSADDGDNPKQIKSYVLVLGSGGMAGGRLIINEIDYDNYGSDDFESLELLNTTQSTLSLAGIKVALVNGATNQTYQVIDLSSVGSLDPGQFLVLGSNFVSPPSTAKYINPQWTSDQIQNGAPDGVAVFDDVTKTLLDALSYEGAVTMAAISGFTAPVSLVEGTALDATVADVNDDIVSLCRLPNGTDTNNANSDWQVCTTRTVGKANVAN